MTDEEGSDDKEIDSDFGDDPTLQSETESPRYRSKPLMDCHESSSSSYVPSPPKRRRQNYLKSTWLMHTKYGQNSQEDMIISSYVPQAYPSTCHLV